MGCIYSRTNGSLLELSQGGRALPSVRRCDRQKQFLHEPDHNKVCGFLRVTGSWFLESSVFGMFWYFGRFKHHEPSATSFRYSRERAGGHVYDRDLQNSAARNKSSRWMNSTTSKRKNTYFWFSAYCKFKTQLLIMKISCSCRQICHCTLNFFYSFSFLVRMRNMWTPHLSADPDATSFRKNKWHILGAVLRHVRV